MPSVHSKSHITLNTLQTEPNATAGRNEYKDHTDPKYIGPGTWNVIHRFAFQARTPEQQRRFIEEMKQICYGFPCDGCKKHCSDYIASHPMDEYLGVTIDINKESLGLGMFIWSWKFHNAVNMRIKKPIMSWDTAYNLYSESETLVCSKNCLESNTDDIGDNNFTNNNFTPIKEILP